MYTVIRETNLKNVYKDFHNLECVKTVEEVKASFEGHFHNTFVYQNTILVIPLCS